MKPSDRIHTLAQEQQRARVEATGSYELHASVVADYLDEEHARRNASEAPSRDIAQRYVERLERQGIGDMDDAEHQTCMLARWDALMGWLDERFGSDEVAAERKAQREASPNVVSINDKANRELQERFRGFIDALNGLTPAEMLRKAADLWELGHGEWAQAVAFTALEEMQKSRRQVIRSLGTVEQESARRGCSCGQHRPGRPATGGDR